MIEIEKIYSDLENMRYYLHEHYPHTWKEMYYEFDIKYSKYLEQNKFQRNLDFSNYEEVLNENCDIDFINEQRLENKETELRLKLSRMERDFNDYDEKIDELLNKLTKTKGA